VRSLVERTEEEETSEENGILTELQLLDSAHHLPLLVSIWTMDETWWRGSADKIAVWQTKKNK
jgi:hypothetical protein